MNNTRGFITVATGNYYCMLAQNLAMSYRLFSKTEYPLYVLTDQKGEKRLKKYFDGVIVMKEPTYTFLDKIAVYQNSPFEETIFLDADMDIVRDISFLFDEFTRNGAEVSCIGSLREITDDDRPIHFGDAAIKRFHLTHYLAFNGGVYYYKKSQKADAFFQYIHDELIPNYRLYELKEFRSGQMADEPLIGLAMVVLDIKPMSSKHDIMKLVQDINTVTWDMKAGSCRLIWYGREVSPAMLHYGTHNTLTKKYVYYNAIVKCRYRHIRFLTPLFVIADETVLLFRHLGRKNDRKAFYRWFSSHFTKEHWSYRINQIKSLFKK